VRRIYRLPWTPAHAVAFRAAVHAVRAARRLLPAPLAHGYNTRFFDAVADTEAWRIAHGKPTPQVVIGETTAPGT
jgi:hypothetical protein